MFDFRQFSIDDSRCDMKVGTDGVMLGAWASVANASRVLDAGAGCGLLSLMIAQRNHDASIDAVERSGEACSDAGKNIAATPLGQRVNVVHADITTMRFNPESYDLIISNPPFFTESLRSPDAGRAESRHEGTFGVEWLIRNARLLLSPVGSLAFIAPSSRDSEIEFLLELHRLNIWRQCTVFPVEGKPAKRTLWQVSPSATCREEKSSLTIRNTDHSLSTDYKNLTSEFYL